MTRRYEQHDFAPDVERQFVEGLKQERLAQGMTQTELAEKMSDLGFKFHQATIYKIENGERKVTVAEAMGFAQILDLGIEEIFYSEALHDDPERRRRLIHTQADRIITELLALDESARRLSYTHRAFVETVRYESGRGLTEYRRVGEPAMPVSEYYEPLLRLTIQNEVLWRLRNEIWTDDANARFNQIAGDVSGFIRLGPADWWSGSDG